MIKTLLFIWALIQTILLSAKCVDALTASDQEIIASVNSPSALDIKRGGRHAKRIILLEGNKVGRVTKNTTQERQELVEAQVAAQKLSSFALSHASPVLRVVDSGTELIAISQRAPGNQLPAFPNAEDIRFLASIPQEKFNDLVRTMRDIRAAGLEVDIGSNNLFYDPLNGFHIIDLTSTLPASDRAKRVSEKEVGDFLTGKPTFVNPDFHQTGDNSWPIDASSILRAKIRAATTEIDRETNVQN